MQNKAKFNLKGLIIPLIGVLVFIFYILFIHLLLNYAISVAVYKTTDYDKIKNYSFLDSLEKKSLDLFMRFKAQLASTNYSTTYSKRELPKNVSKDIMVIAVDEKSLNEIGRWPFRRYNHAKLVDYFTNSKYRENTLLFDVFFVEPDRQNPEDDAVFMESLKNNGNVVFDYIARDHQYSTKEEKDEMQGRIDFQIKKFGELKNISGTIKDAVPFLGFTPPLIPYMDNIQDIGYANVIEDPDKIVRKYPIVAKSLTKDELNFSEIKEGDYADMLLLVSYKIGFDGDKSYKLERFEPRIFEQDGLQLAQRKILSKNDIDTIRIKTDKVISDFQIELGNIKAKYEKSNRENIKSIKNYLKTSSMDKELKTQVLSVFEDEANLKNTEDLLKDLSDNLLELSIKDKKLEKDARYFAGLYKKCMKIDKVGETKIVNGKTEVISLYDFLYNDKKVNFDEIIKINEKFFMSVPLLLISRYYHVEKNNIEVIYGKEIRLNNPLVYNADTEKLEKPECLKNKKYFSIPIDNRGFIQINFAGARSSSVRTDPTTFDVYSYSDFVSGEKSFLVKNKVVLVGAFANGMADDLKQTPFKTMFGIEVIANTVNSAIMNDFIHNFDNWVYLIILLLASITVAFIASNKNILRAYIYSFLFALAYYIFAAVLFVTQSVVLEVAKVLIISALSLTSVIVYRVFTEEKQKKQIKNIFSKYVNASVVEQLLKHPPELGGIDMDITVQFSDIRGFTTLSETMPPQELVELLNNYLTAMTDVIIETDGTLDKYIGDAIMCFWGAPNPYDNHAELACRAALKQMRKLKEINAAQPINKRINIGIGLNSGIMTAGNMGSEGRMNYTIMGDNVNLGSRLEGINKYYGTNIIVSESTYEKVKDKFVFRELDNIKVKGKNRPVRIFELIGDIEELKLLEGT